MQAPLVIHPGSGFHRQALALLGALSLCTSCAAPRRAPLCDADVAASVAGRAATVADLETALALADLGPLGFYGAPQFNFADPENLNFWTNCAWLYEPGVRQARRKVELKRALARGAGTVPSIGLGADHVRNRGDYETEAMATIDLLALLGLGPAQAARELARIEVCEALADLEAAVWAANYRWQRAYSRLAAALERKDLIAAIFKEADEDSARIKTLEEGGRGAPAEFAWARAGVARVEEARLKSVIEAELAQEELSVATGLPPGQPALARAVEVVAREKVSRYVEPSMHEPWSHDAVTDPAMLLAHLPRLRAAKLRYAIAEAKVRSAAADSWPGIEIGPKLTIVPDDVLTGGIVDLTIPLPAAARSRVCAALVERSAARDAVEDELVAALARHHSLLARKRALSEVRYKVRARRDAAVEMWQAARARFRSDESALSGWVLSLEMRLEAALDAIATAESMAILDADLGEASGPWRGAANPESIPETRPQ
jgi:outer membrane protein TolC